MNKPLLIFFTICFSFVCCFCIGKFGESVNTAENVIISQQCTVIIDAGHGGKDAGTTGADGAKEKDINLAIALKLYDFLRVCGLKAVLIRSGDYEFYKTGEERTKSDLYNRLDYVNSFKNSILVSIHQNHYEDQTEWGTQIWYSANTEKSRVLADCVLQNIKNYIQPSNKRTNMESDDSYYILYKATVPSIMVECGFMSNPSENKKLQQDSYQKDMAYCIMLGVGTQIT